ncbi:bifunctional pyr operon transcriptional regulator/uracil phosphoribosyltransferase PyrR [bacterium]|nr:bifunctional pyr operon transcriptional regulator/uracil phosphoribosyltransferase PyrR [bacterium]
MLQCLPTINRELEESAVSVLKKNQIMDAENIRRAITRIAHEICEHTKGVSDLVLIGILQRGDILAERIAQQIEKIEGTPPPVGALDVTFHRDDTMTHSGRNANKKPSHIPFDLDNKHVVLVDDVLYTGRTVRAAMDELNDYGRPQSIRLAVMVDRGHRELPIHADFIGRNVPTSHLEKIGVDLVETAGKDSIVLVQANLEESQKGA